ncbi:MAG TPA: cation diffusion facilitator family transporter [Vitreimonas sp.]|uniref:cation diffusion facilitator family transporter n=1 Tax=Vitreimonas sp. TaxID=3069702 RepID=UPI002D718293|nr:cation diffusion facilitator family transporter [Vitreimonas sp.]HYD87021.1 cation diffusion facilitator family transporter [Vitreimonas sp.]
MHGHHGHDHHHDHAHHHAPPSDKRYTVAIVLNVAFVALEAAAGFLANSTALLSDAAHNLSDVLGLALAGGAAWLAKQQASERRTYGFAKATVLAALANALVLVVACGGILWEALRRFIAPEPVEPGFVMTVAAIGVLINGATAMLFLAGRKQDVNVRGAYLHMLADAGVSAAVIVAGAAIWITGFDWIDPAISVGVVLLILWGTWRLLRESLDLALDAAPSHIDVAEVRAFLAAQAGVTAVHDLHIWAMSAATPALTAHVVRPEGSDDGFLARVSDEIEQRFGIAHVTLQVERTQRDDCAECD